MKNIRSYKDLKITLSPGINLLVGPNNSGKSTIIRSVYKIQDSYSLDLKDIRTLQLSGEIFIFLQNITTKDSETFKHSNSSFNKMNFPEKGLIWHNFRNNLVEKTASQEALFIDLLRTPFENNVSFVSFARNRGNAINFISLPSSENQNCFIYPYFSKRKLISYNLQPNNNDAYSVKPDLEQLTSKIQMLSNKSHPHNQIFENAVKDILGFNIGVITLDKGMTSIGQFINESVTIPLEKMGEGVANILGLLVSILTKDGRLYLIEEPENDIHPRALKKLLELISLRANKNQFIISTHSNIVVRMLGENASIFQFKWKPYEIEETDRIPTTEVYELTDTPDSKIELLSELGYELLDYNLYTAYLILEESSAQYLFEKLLIPNFFPDLYQKIKIISSAGVGNLSKRFSDLNSIFMFIHTSKVYTQRAWVFADGDASGIKNIEKLRSTYKNWDSAHFQYFKKENIEEYYPRIFHDEFCNNILKIVNPDSRQNEKILFNDRFRIWAETNPTACKKELGETAKELIETLASINEKLKSKI